MAGKTELGKARKPKTPRKTSKAGSKKRAGRTLSDQDVSNIASAVSRILAVQSGRASARYIGEEAKRRAGRTVSDQDKVFGRGVGFKKGGSAKKRAKGGRVKK